MFIINDYVKYEFLKFLVILIYYLNKKKCFFNMMSRILFIYFGE